MRRRMRAQACDQLGKVSSPVTGNRSCNRGIGGNRARLAEEIPLTARIRLELDPDSLSAGPRHTASPRRRELFNDKQPTPSR